MTQQTNNPEQSTHSGILLVNKPKGKNSFALVAALRRILKVKKIGHAGTLDPFATGVMVMLVGKEYTRLSDQMLCADKEYLAHVHFGIETDSYDCTGKIVRQSDIVPSDDELKRALGHFQGSVEQIPPMFSAKKRQGKKLYELARKGVVVEREPVKVSMEVHLLKYEYPIAEIQVSCSKGTYIRSIAHDLGVFLGCGAHLSALQRIRSGIFHIDNCLDGALLDQPHCNAQILDPLLIKTRTLNCRSEE